MNKQVIKPSDLCKVHIEYMWMTAFPNPYYRSEKLKSQSTSREIYDSKIYFVALDREGGSFQLNLVFSCDLDLSSAVKTDTCLGVPIRLEM